MTKEPKNKITLVELRAAIGRGSRLCPQCVPMNNVRFKDQQFWSVCVARLPKKAGLPLDANVMIVSNNEGPEHLSILVPDDEEARAFLEKASPRQGDPGLYHTQREMIFLRLDIAKFTQFREELQPRVLAELHELVHGELQTPHV